jgi:hypothetical protein
MKNRTCSGYNKIMEKLDEKTIDHLEAHIPELAEAAAKQAYWQTLASGSSVLIAENGELTEVFPDGKKKSVVKIEPFVKVRKGTITLK